VHTLQVILQELKPLIPKEFLQKNFTTKNLSIFFYYS
jgi:hypothetical protein